MYYMRGSVPPFRGLLLDRTNGTQGAVVPVPSRHQFVSPTRVFHVPPSFHPYHYRYNEGRENRLLYDKALEGLRQWNKDPNFYTGYAKNYISKSVKKGAVDDPRVAYIKDASALISSCQELLEERVEGFTGKAAGVEGIKRVKEAQKLVGKFFAESGVEGEGADKIAAYVAAH